MPAGIVIPKINAVWLVSLDGVGGYEHWPFEQI